MPTISRIVEYSSLLDGLALAACLLLLVFLAFNRLQYGRLFLDRRSGHRLEGFSEEMTLQLMSQRSQQAYENLQGLLMHEFEALRMFSGDDLSIRTQAGGLGAAGTPKSFRRAQEMLRRGEDAAAIQRRCGLEHGEWKLLQGLHQYAQANRFRGQGPQPAGSRSTV